MSVSLGLVLPVCAWDHQYHDAWTVCDLMCPRLSISLCLGCPYSLISETVYPCLFPQCCCIPQTLDPICAPRHRRMTPEHSIHRSPHVQWLWELGNRTESWNSVQLPGWGDKLLHPGLRHKLMGAFARSSVGVSAPSGMCEGLDPAALVPVVLSSSSPIAGS